MILLDHKNALIQPFKKWSYLRHIACTFISMDCWQIAFHRAAIGQFECSGLEKHFVKRYLFEWYCAGKCIKAVNAVIQPRAKHMQGRFSSINTIGIIASHLNITIKPGQGGDIFTTVPIYLMLIIFIYFSILLFPPLVFLYSCLFAVWITLNYTVLPER